MNVVTNGNMRRSKGFFIVYAPANGFQTTICSYAELANSVFVAFRFLQQFPENVFSSFSFEINYSPILELEPQSSQTVVFVFVSHNYAICRGFDGSHIYLTRWNIDTAFATSSITVFKGSRLNSDASALNTKFHIRTIRMINMYELLFNQSRGYG